MKYIKIILTISLTIIKINTKKIGKRDLLDECNKYSDCFNCSLSKINTGKENECKWKNNVCISSSNNPIILDWKNQFENCNDLSSIQIQNKYCGEIKYEKKKKKGILQFQKVNEYYGAINLFCSYKFSNSYSSASYKIETKFNAKYTSSSNRILIGYKINYKNGNSEFKNIYSNLGELIFDEVNNIEIYIYSSILYEESPFEIYINYQKNTILISVYLIIGIIILVIFICAITIYCFTRKLSIQNIIREEEILRRITQSFSQSNQMQEIHLQNLTRKIENLLNNPNLLGKRICKKEYERYGTNCTICLEELKVDVDEVSLTPCYHVFHFDCLSNWLRKNITNIKCPNCNMDLSPEEDNSENSENNGAYSNRENHYFTESVAINNNNNRAQFNNFARVSHNTINNIGESQNSRNVNNRYRNVNDNNNNNNNYNNNNNNNNNNNTNINNNNNNNNINRESRVSNRNFQSIKDIDGLESLDI